MDASSASRAARTSATVSRTLAHARWCVSASAPRSSRSRAVVRSASSRASSRDRPAAVDASRHTPWTYSAASKCSWPKMRSSAGTSFAASLVGRRDRLRVGRKEPARCMPVRGEVVGPSIARRTRRFAATAWPRRGYSVEKRSRRRLGHNAEDKQQHFSSKAPGPQRCANERRVTPNAQRNAAWLTSRATAPSNRPAPTPAEREPCPHARY
mmetsp:Transcript_34011/g.102467  ORF Transcript_34011/g.102467 Transcript_34011/m.102467 type:complete len:211 (-) Transcript_34011:265-897(-)